MSTALFDQADAIARYQALVKVEIKNRLKADDQRLARALIVADAKRSLDADGFKAFLEKIECGESTSRELLKIAKAGTADDVRRATALRVADHRARRKAATDAAVTSLDVTAPAAEAKQHTPAPRPKLTPAQLKQRIAAERLSEECRLLLAAETASGVANSFFEDDERTTRTVNDADADTIEAVKSARDAWDHLYRGLCADQDKTNVVPLKKKEA
jgi:hypothetical protein